MLIEQSVYNCDEQVNSVANDILKISLFWEKRLDIL